MEISEQPSTKSPSVPIHHPPNSAFSLVEALIAGSILILIFSLAYRMNVSSNQKSLTGKLVLQMDALKAANDLLFELRRCSDFVRPHLGETCSYLLARDMMNQMLFLYLDQDLESSRTFKKTLYKLKSYRDSHTGTFQDKDERVLMRAIKRLTFTCLDPNTVQINLIVANDRDDFQFITRVSAMNLGDLE